MMLEFQTALHPPRVHFAAVDAYVLVVRPYTTNRFGAYVQRIGWDRGEERIFKSLDEAKLWLDDQARTLDRSVA